MHKVSFSLLLKMPSTLRQGLWRRQPALASLRVSFPMHVSGKPSPFLHRRQTSTYSTCLHQFQAAPVDPLLPAIQLDLSHHQRQPATPRSSPGQATINYTTDTSGTQPTPGSLFASTIWAVGPLSAWARLAPANQPFSQVVPTPAISFMSSSSLLPYDGPLSNASQLPTML